jgi:hypothetical protein
MQNIQKTGELEAHNYDKHVTWIEGHIYYKYTRHTAHMEL